MSGKVGRTWTHSAYLPRSAGAGRPPKLSPRQIAYLRRRLEAGDRAQTVADQAGVSLTTLRRSLGVKPTKHFTNGRKVLTPEQVAEVRQRFNDGDRPQALALEYGVSHSTIRRVLHLAPDSKYH